MEFRLTSYREQTRSRFVYELPLEEWVCTGTAGPVSSGHPSIQAKNLYMGQASRGGLLPGATGFRTGLNHCSVTPRLDQMALQS